MRSTSVTSTGARARPRAAASPPKPPPTITTLGRPSMLPIVGRFSALAGEPAAVGHDGQERGGHGGGQPAGLHPGRGRGPPAAVVEGGLGALRVEREVPQARAPGRRTSSGSPTRSRAPPPRRPGRGCRWRRKGPPGDRRPSRAAAGTPAITSATPSAVPSFHTAKRSRRCGAAKTMPARPEARSRVATSARATERRANATGRTPSRTCTAGRAGLRTAPRTPSSPSIGRARKVRATSGATRARAESAGRWTAAASFSAKAGSQRRRAPRTGFVRAGSKRRNSSRASGSRTSGATRLSARVASASGGKLRPGKRIGGTATSPCV